MVTSLPCFSEHFLSENQGGRIRHFSWSGLLKNELKIKTNLRRIKPIYFSRGFHLPDVSYFTRRRALFDAANILSYFSPQHVVMWFLHINLWHTLCWKFLPPEEKLVQFEKLSQDWFWLLTAANVFTLHYFDCFTMGFSFFTGGYSWRCWDFYECFTLNFHLL